jgi:high-affinity iron transporter
MGLIIRERLARVSEGKAFGAVLITSFLMLGREGLEAAAMLASLATQEETQSLVPAAAAGLVLAVVVAGLWLKLGRAVNLSSVFKASAIFMSIFSIQLVIYAFHEFSEANAIPMLDNNYWHLATEDYSPEGVYGAWLSYMMAASPFLYAIYAKLTKNKQQ